MSLMLLNALKKDKQLVHYLFVIFCGSLCMVGAQKISAPSLGEYQYFIGLFTCATCNVSWLISRALFREHNPISRRHVAVAGGIAVLLMFNQTWHYLVSLDPQPLSASHIMWRLKQGINEITGLLSSCILVLSFWESLRGFNSKTHAQKVQSVIFASAYFLAVVNASILPVFIFSPAEIALYNPLITTSSALLIVFAMHTVMTLQTSNSIKQMPLQNDENEVGFDSDEVKALSDSSQQEQIPPELVAGISKLMNEQQLFLQTNLKIADFAQALHMPEYKISRAIRYHYKVANFNLFVNQYRVNYAKALLVSEQAKEWSILSIALESGFSSLATFNRVFKSIVGGIPNEYRKQNSNYQSHTLTGLVE